jgi:hypothetical protein
MITATLGIPFEKTACFIDVIKSMLPNQLPNRYWFTRGIIAGIPLERLEYIYISADNSPVNVFGAIFEHGSVYRLDNSNLPEQCEGR